MRAHGLSVHGHLGRSYGDLLRCRCFFVQALAVHPTLWLDLQQPILGCGNAAKIFPDMLFPYIADGNLVSVAIHDGNAKQFLRQENALSMMAKARWRKSARNAFDSSNQL